MTIGAFVDQGTAPSTEAMAAATGPARPWWERLVAWLADTYGLAGEPLFFGKDSGWVLRYRRSGRSLVTLLPRAGGAGALVIVGPSVADEAAAMPLSGVTREALAGAHPYPDGRWLWLTLDGDAVAADIERLVALKSPPPRRPRQPARQPGGPG